jgi:hypothetical protein
MEMVFIHRALWVAIFPFMYKELSLVLGLGLSLMQNIDFLSTESRRNRRIILANEILFFQFVIFPRRAVITASGVQH